MAHGPRTVAELIEEDGWSYPVSVARLEREHALDNILIDENGDSMMLGELLAQADIDRFEDEDDLYEKLEPLFERERERRSVGLVGKIKQWVLGTYVR